MTKSTTNSAPRIDMLGIDIAKNVFQLHGVDARGHVVLQRRVMRDQLLFVLAQIEPCTIAVEACTGAFTWARKFEALGHAVKVISPQYVKPFVRRQKNDGNDAEAIATAARQPHIPLVPKKTVEQQDIQALHRARQRMVNHRTAVVSQMRGLLLDRGIAMAKSITRARRLIPDILADPANELTAMARETIGELYDLLVDLDRRIASFDRKIAHVFRNSEACQRIARIKGCRPEDGDCNGGGDRRRIGVPQWPPPCRLGRARAASVLQRRQARADGHLQARQPAPAHAARPRGSCRRENGPEQDRPAEPVGQRTSGAARLQPRNGGGGQQDRTDHLGCLAVWPTLP